MPGAAHVAIRDASDLAEVRIAYLRALEEEREELVVELAAGCIGLDDGNRPPSLELAPVNAKSPPDLAVTLRCSEGISVLAGIPVRIAAHSLTLEGIALVGATGSALVASVVAVAELRRVRVLGTISSGYERAAVDLNAAGRTGTAVRVHETVIARNTSRDAALGLYCSSNGWFEQAHLEELTVTAGAGDAVVAIDALTTLRAGRCALRSEGARTLLRLAWPVLDGELTDCRLSPGRASLVEIGNTLPGAQPRLRLAGSTLVAGEDELPPSVEAEARPVESDPGEVDAAIEEVVTVAADELRTIDSRLEV